MTVARDVDEVAGGVPGVDDPDGVVVRDAGRDHLWLVGVDDARVRLLWLKARDPPRRLTLIRQLDAVQLLCRGPELVPVVVQRRVDVDRDTHGGLSPRRS